LDIRSLGMILLALSFSGCSSKDRQPDPDRRELRFEKALSEAVPLFTEYVLPNSMARLPGFDINAHLRDVDARRRALTGVFHSPEGVRFLTNRLGSEKDEEAAVCMLKILSESGIPEARGVVKAYAGHENEVIRSNARAFLGR